MSTVSDRDQGIDDLPREVVAAWVNALPRTRVPRTSEWSTHLALELLKEELRRGGRGGRCEGVPC